MEAKFKTPFKPFHLALCEMIDAGATNVKECASVGECSDQTIRNWCGELTGVSEEIAHRITRHHPKPDVRRRLAESRVSGAEFFVQTAAGETDINRDGRTDAHDAVLAVSKIVRDASSDLDTLIGDSAGGLNIAEALRAVDALNALRAEIQRAIGAITKAAKGVRR